MLTYSLPNFGTFIEPSVMRVTYRYLSLPSWSHQACPEGLIRHPRIFRWVSLGRTTWFIRTPPTLLQDQKSSKSSSTLLPRPLAGLPPKSHYFTSKPLLPPRREISNPLQASAFSLCLSLYTACSHNANFAARKHKHRRFGSRTRKGSRFLWAIEIYLCKANVYNLRCSVTREQCF